MSIDLLVKTLPKTSSELRSMIWYDSVRHTILMDDVLEVQLRILMRTIFSSNWDKTSDFGQTIHNHQNWVVSLIEVGSPEIKSILTSSHFQLGIDKGWSKPAFMWTAFMRQQLSQRATKAAVSFFHLCPLSKGFRSGYILLLPGWIDSLDEWASDKIWSRSSRFFGTTNWSLNHRILFSST